MASDNKEGVRAAQKYLIDPLNAPESWQETGPSTTHQLSPKQFSTISSPKDRRSDKMEIDPPTPTSSRSHRSSSKSGVYATPPDSASPRRQRFPNPFETTSYRSEAFNDYSDPKQKGHSVDGMDGRSNRRRGNSLNSRFPGDQSHRPLDIIRQETKAAQRSPHLKRRSQPRPDTIDTLDNVVFGGVYHHEGPFDATLKARNTDPRTAPVEAVRTSNQEALRATPKERVLDSLERHRPLSGTAAVPSGMPGPDGEIMNYEEGTDLMIAEGNYKRWPGVKYLPEDLKGKGEPSYSIQAALNNHKRNSGQGKQTSDRNSEYEMTAQPRRLSKANNGSIYSGSQTSLKRAGSTSGRLESVAGSLKKSLSLRRKNINLR